MTELRRVMVDQDRCVGSGDCANVAPQAFEVDEDAGLARVLPGAAHTDPALLQRAQHNCPTAAISVDEGG